MQLNFKFLTSPSALSVMCVAVFTMISAMSAPASAQTDVATKSATDQVKALLAAHKTGGVELPLSLIATLEENPALVEPLIVASDGASQPLLATISAAVSQVMAMMAETDPAAVARMKLAIDTRGSALLRKQIAANFTEAAIATAAPAKTITMASANM